MRETSSPPSEMCFMTTFLSDGEARGRCLVLSPRKQELARRDIPS
jgi:hypothetical protein